MNLKSKHWPLIEIEKAPGDLCVDLASRLPQFIGAHSATEKILRDATVAVVASGSVGRRMALHCARLMPKLLIIIDPARYKPENLLTQEIGPADIGRFKAVSTGEYCKAISPSTLVLVHTGPVQELPQRTLAQVQVALLSSDNLAAEVHLTQRCLHLGLPLIQASVDGPTLVAQVRTLGNKDGHGPCLACGFGEAEWEHLAGETQFACGGTGNTGTQTVTTQPTISTSFLCSLAADLAMNQWLRLLLSLGKPVVDAQLQYCGFTHRTGISPLVRNPNCPCQHVRWNHIGLDDSLQNQTLEMLLHRAGLSTSQGMLSTLELDGLEYVESATCCGKLRPVERFVPHGAAANCSDCGQTMVTTLFHRHRRVPIHMLPASRTLGDLVGHEAPSALIESDHAGWLFTSESSIQLDGPSAHHLENMS